VLISNEKLDLAKQHGLKIKIILRLCFTLIPAAEDPALPCEGYKMNSTFVVAQIQCFTFCKAPNVQKPVRTFDVMPNTRIHNDCNANTILKAWISPCKNLPNNGKCDYTFKKNSLLSRNMMSATFLSGFFYKSVLLMRFVNMLDDRILVEYSYR